MKRYIVRDGHWLWIGGKTGGHPALKVNGKVVMARRHYWEEKYGSQPPNRLEVRCGSQNCVNPDHCSPHVNLKKKVRKTHAERREERLEMYMLRGCEKVSTIAAMYGVSYTHVSRVHTLGRIGAL